MAARSPFHLLAGRPLWWRLGAAMAGVMFCLVLTAGMLSVLRQSSMIVEMLVQRGHGLARSIATAAINPLLLRDLAALEQLMLAQVHSDDILEIQIIDADGKVVADAELRNGVAAPRFGRAIPDPPGDAAPGHTDNVRILALPGRDFYIHRDHPIIWHRLVVGDQKIGWLRLVIDSAPAHAMRKWVVTWAVLLTIIIMGLSMSALYLLMRRPLAELKRAAAFAGTLDQQHGAQAPGSDISSEIRQLFDVLNGASARLAEQGQSLKQSQAFLESLTENLSDGVYVSDPDGICLFMNREAERLTGFARQEVLQRRIRDVFRPHDARGLVTGGDTPRTRALASGLMVRTDESSFVRKDGTLMPVTLAASPLVIDGKPHGVVIAFQDISRRKEAEAAMQAARQAAEAASRAKSNFLSIVSHELRTPMNSILGMAYLALQTDLPPKSREHVGSVQVAALKLMRIINDMLDYSKIVDGQLLVQHNTFDLDKMLADVLLQVSHEARAKRLALQQVIAPDVPRWLVGDAEHLGRALVKFAENAVKFSDRGNVVLGVQLLEHGAGDALLQFSVSDEGVGLSRAAQAELFTTFQQANDALTRSHGGMGLGLAIASQLSSLMGGTIGVDSQPGHGATFWIKLRLGLGLQLDPAPELFTASAQVSRALDGHADAPAAGLAALDRTALAAVLGELRTLMADNDYSARAALERHAGLLKDLSTPLYEQCDSALRAFDFDAAVEILDKFAAAADTA